MFTGFAGEADDCDVRGAELSNEGHSTHQWRGKRSRGFSCPVPRLPRNKV